jgi:deoxyribodipyrimidine photo-lyase
MDCFASLAMTEMASTPEIGLSSHCFRGDLLVAPANIRNKDGRGLRVFAPFWRRVQASGDPPKPLLPPKALCPGPHIGGDTIESWRLEATNPEWAGDLGEAWKPGELPAQARLAEFL